MDIDVIVYNDFIKIIKIYLVWIGWDGIECAGLWVLSVKLRFAFALTFICTDKYTQIHKRMYLDLILGEIRTYYVRFEKIDKQKKKKK